MDSITPVVGGQGGLGPGLGKIRTTIQLGKIRITIQPGKIRITIPGRVQMPDRRVSKFWTRFGDQHIPRRSGLRADITQKIQRIARNIISDTFQNSS